MAKNYATTDFNLQRELGSIIGKKKASDGIIKVLDKYWNLQKNPDYSVARSVAKLAKQINMNQSYIYELITFLKEKELLETGEDGRIYTTWLYNSCRESCYLQTIKEHKEKHKHIKGYKTKYKNTSTQKYQKYQSGELKQNYQNHNNFDNESTHVGNESECFLIDLSIRKTEEFPEKPRAHIRNIKTLSTREEKLNNTKAPIDSACSVGSHTETLDLQAEEGAISKKDQSSHDVLQGHIHLINFTNEGEIEKQTTSSPNEAKDEDAGQTTNKPPKPKTANTKRQNKKNKAGAQKYPIQVSEEIAEAVFHQVRREHRAQVTELLTIMAQRRKFVNKYAIEALYRRITAMKLNKINTHDALDQSILLQYNWVYEPTKKYYEKKYKKSDCTKQQTQYQHANGASGQIMQSIHNSLHEAYMKNSQGKGISSQEPKRIFNFAKNGRYY